MDYPVQPILCGYQCRCSMQVYVADWIGRQVRELLPSSCDAQAKRTVQRKLPIKQLCCCWCCIVIVHPRSSSSSATQLPIFVSTECPDCYDRHIYKQTRAKGPSVVAASHPDRRILACRNACYADALADPSHLHTVIKLSTPATPSACLSGRHYLASSKASRLHQQDVQWWENIGHLEIATNRYWSRLRVLKPDWIRLFFHPKQCFSLTNFSSIPSNHPNSSKRIGP